MTNIHTKQEQVCVFCEIVQHTRQADIFYENQYIIAMLDSDWAVKGHSLVIWKDHQVNAADLKEAEYLQFAKGYYRVERALLKILHKNRAITLKTGGLISHFHYHTYPVDIDTNWHTIKNIFEKNVQYTPKSDERKQLVKELTLMLIL